MADLLDIVPATAVDVVRINGERVVVRGLNAPAVASIVARFPDVKKLLDGGTDDLVLRLIELAGAAVGPIIAAGTGHLGDERYEQHAGTVLMLEQQVDLLTAIKGLTFPNGIGSFAEKLTRLIGGAGEGAKTVKVRLKRSPSASQPLSDGDSRQTLQ